MSLRGLLAIQERGDVIADAVDLNIGPGARFDFLVVGASHVVDGAARIAFGPGLVLIELHLETVESGASDLRMAGIPKEHTAVEMLDRGLELQPQLEIRELISGDQPSLAQLAFLAAHHNAAILHGPIALADNLPSGEILAVE